MRDRVNSSYDRNRDFFYIPYTLKAVNNQSIVNHDSDRNLYIYGYISTYNGHGGDVSTIIAAI